MWNAMNIPEPSGTFWNLLWGNVVTLQRNTTHSINTTSRCPTKNVPEGSGTFRKLLECSCIQHKLRKFQKVPEASGMFLHATHFTIIKYNSRLWCKILSLLVVNLNFDLIPICPIHLKSYCHRSHHL